MDDKHNTFKEKMRDLVLRTRAPKAIACGALSSIDESPVLTDAEARMLTALSQELGSLRELCRVLGIGCTSTLDRLVWRSRRSSPRTVARVRVALRREAARRHVVAAEGLVH